MPEYLEFVIWNQISEKISNFREIAIHQKTGQFKIVWSILVNPFTYLQFAIFSACFKVIY
jgi:hypothetical protein